MPGWVCGFAAAMLCPTLLVVHGCHAATEEVTDAQSSRPVHDSAGVSIIESARPVSAASWQVSELPEVTIGRSGSPEQDLYQVRDAVRLSDGRIVIANGGGSDVRWYSSEGALLVRVGGQGDGPGEFRFLSSLLVLPGDSVVAHDVASQRLSLFGPDAALSRTLRIDGGPPGLLLLTRLGDGSYLMASGGVFRAGASGPTRIVRDTTRIYRLGDDGDVSEPLLEIEGMEVVIGPSGGAPTDGAPTVGRHPRPFGRNSAVAASGNGLVTGDSGFGELHFRTPEGRPWLVARWEASSRSVTSDDARAEQEHRLARQRDPDVVARLRDAWAQHPPPPDVMPVFDPPILLDADGNVWTKEYAPRFEPDPNRFHVIDPGGVWLTTLRVPAGVRVLSIGHEHLVGVQVDELGVEAVVVHRVRRE